jgi:hypothetical protein
MHLPEQVQQGARLDLAVGRRHPAGDADQRLGDGDLPATIRPLVVLPGYRLPKRASSLQLQGNPGAGRLTSLPRGASPACFWTSSGPRSTLGE